MNNVKYRRNYKTNILDQQKWSKSNTNNSLKIIILFFASTNLNFIRIYQILSFFRFTSFKWYKSNIQIYEVGYFLRFYLFLYISIKLHWWNIKGSVSLTWIRKTLRFFTRTFIDRVRLSQSCTDTTRRQLILNN